MLEAAGASQWTSKTAFQEKRDATQVETVYHIKVIYSSITKLAKSSYKGNMLTIKMRHKEG